METLGWIGAICFAMCGVPQAWKCWKTRSADDLSWTFLLLWLTGEVLTIIYIWPTKQYPLLFNYIINLASLFIILQVKTKVLPKNLR